VADVVRDRHDYNAQYYRDNIEKEQARNRAWRLRTQFDLTQGAFDTRFAQQGSCCAICAAERPGGRWDQWEVDHDHEDEAHGVMTVRGILCHQCNKLLGFANDNPATLLAAAEYLNKRGAK
jgi:hypothetical protein